MKSPSRHQLLWLIFGIVFLTHAGSRVTTSSDSRWVLPVALSLIHDGDIELDEYRERIEADQFYAIDQVGGRLYNKFPIGTPLLVTPLVFVADVAVAEALGLSLRNISQRRRLDQLERFLASILVALTALLMFRIAEQQGLARGPSLLLVGIFAFATPAWSTASRALWQHGPSMLLLAAALYLLLRSRENPAWILGLVPLLALAWLVRPTNVVSLVVLAAIGFLVDRRQTLLSIALALPLLGGFLLLNLKIYGGFLPPYYQASRLVLGPSFGEALAGNLISPNRGLWIFSPVLLLVLVGIWLKIRRREFGRIDAGLVAILLLHLGAISMFPHWWGGYSQGPRLFTDMIPYLVYFLIPPLASLGPLRGRRRQLAAAGLFLLVLISVAIHYRCATRLETVGWNAEPVSVDEDPSRIWDWSDLQFLR